MTSTATTARKPAARKAPTKPATKATPAKAAAKESSPIKAPAKPAAKKVEVKPEPTTLVEALTSRQAVLVKVRGNGTKRSLPYLAVGTEARKQAEIVAKKHADGVTVEAIADELSVSLATARRFLTNLALAHAVEAGTHDAAWTPSTKEVIVQTVVMKK